ncbi:PREDICTED: probable folate-biopterin transporter 7 [Nelumbo nucifera]|uniref:Probable folate-biopterin transporter 7 n=1 Tax=Nelumbo nucifera TaxID=4432 RepID=A0A1U7Z915_NELNU|nr:PREDICTED: probable folate-biopterin transporter 7 [Nelumbo nucifera]
MSWPAGNPLRPLLGFGYWVQGFQCFPWMGVSFFLKDSLNAAPSTLQLLQTLADIPKIIKWFHGIVSDAIYIRGQHRIPYIAIGDQDWKEDEQLLDLSMRNELEEEPVPSATSWLSIGYFPSSGISIFTITLLLCVSNLGASIVEVVHEALVTEVGRQMSQSSPSTGLKSFVMVASSVGGVFGNFLSIRGIKHYSPKRMFVAFGLLLSVQLLTTFTVHESSLDLPKSASDSGIQEKFFELSIALCEPKILYAIAWYATSYAIVPSFKGTMFFHQTQHLNLAPSVLVYSSLFGEAATLLWSITYSYNQRLQSVPPGELISIVQVIMALFKFSNVLFVNGFYKKIGIEDSLYVVIFLGLSDVLSGFRWLPFSVILAKLCPQGCEGSLMAFVMSSIELAYFICRTLGIALMILLGISENDFSKLPEAILIQVIFTLLPLCWSSCILIGVS